MEVYSPFEKTREESNQYFAGLRQRADQMNVSDETLAEYIRVYFESYREIIEGFFPAFVPFIPLYSNYPYETLILRLGNNGVIIGHRPSATSDIQIMRPDELDLPVDSLNILDIKRCLQLPFMKFDYQIRNYDANEAKIEGVSDALQTALAYFWTTLEPQDFNRLCQELLQAEGIDLEFPPRAADIGFDALGKVLFQEPAGFRRFEKWAFEFKHYRTDRVSASLLRQLEARLGSDDSRFDLVCVVTSGDLTSIGNHIAVRNPHIRVWDRAILNRLINHHLNVLGSHFADYSIALEKLSQQLTEPSADAIPVADRLEEFKFRLDGCPTGNEHFSEYERIGTDLWHFLFHEELGTPRTQCRTLDGKQRRDVLFRNQQMTRFFQRIAQRFHADFVIVDFKNYAKPVDSDVIYDVEKYANKALGQFVAVVSRFGADETVLTAQIRLFRDRDICVLIISDKQMLEMIRRKEKDERPEDVLEDLLDELLIGF